MPRNPFREAAERYRKLDLQKIVLKVIGRNAAYLIELNKEQLERGYDSNRDPLPKYRSKSYAKFKRTLNPRGVTDLRNKGDFWAGFYVDVSSFPASIWSRDKKTAKLVKQYGVSIFGLDSIRTKKFNDYIRPQIVEEVDHVLSV